MEFDRHHSPHCDRYLSTWPHGKPNVEQMIGDVPGGFIPPFSGLAAATALTGRIV